MDFLNSTDVNIKKSKFIELFHFGRCLQFTPQRMQDLMRIYLDSGVKLESGVKSGDQFDGGIYPNHSHYVVDLVKEWYEMLGYYPMSIDHDCNDDQINLIQAITDNSLYTWKGAVIYTILENLEEVRKQFLSCPAIDDTRNKPHEKLTVNILKTVFKNFDNEQLKDNITESTLFQGNLDNRLKPKSLLKVLKILADYRGGMYVVIKDILNDWVKRVVASQSSFKDSGALLMLIDRVTYHMRKFMFHLVKHVMLLQKTIISVLGEKTPEPDSDGPTPEINWYKRLLMNNDLLMKNMFDGSFDGSTVRIEKEKTPSQGPEPESKWYKRSKWKLNGTNNDLLKVQEKVFFEKNTTCTFLKDSVNEFVNMYYKEKYQLPKEKLPSNFEMHAEVEKPDFGPLCNLNISNLYELFLIKM